MHKDVYLFIHKFNSDFLEYIQWVQVLMHMKIFFKKSYEKLSSNKYISILSVPKHIWIAILVDFLNKYTLLQIVLFELVSSSWLL